MGALDSEGPEEFFYEPLKENEDDWSIIRFLHFPGSVKQFIEKYMVKDSFDKIEKDVYVSELFKGSETYYFYLSKTNFKGWNIIMEISGPDMEELALLDYLECGYLKNAGANISEIIEIEEDEGGVEAEKTELVLKA